MKELGTITLGILAIVGIGSIILNVLPFVLPVLLIAIIVGLYDSAKQKWSRRNGRSNRK